MNLNFCRHHCGRASHPHEVMYDHIEQKWYLFMNDDYHRWGQDGCGCISIEDASALFKHVPEGWCTLYGNVFRFEYGNAEDIMWKIRIKSSEGCTCPFIAEHIMYDMNHDKKIEEWRECEEKRQKLVEDRMKKYQEKEDAKRKELS